MEEFIEALIKQAGLTEQQAKKALEVIISKVKVKVPESFHGAIDSVFGSVSDGSSGNQQQTGSQTSGQTQKERARAKLEEFGSEARKRINELAEKVEGLAEETRDRAEELVDIMRERLNAFLNERKH